MSPGSVAIGCQLKLVYGKFPLKTIFKKKNCSFVYRCRIDNCVTQDLYIQRFKELYLNSCEMNIHVHLTEYIIGSYYVRLLLLDVYSSKTIRVV